MVGGKDRIGLHEARPTMTKVLAPGVFDVFHIGHLNYLMAASSHGSHLVVAVQEDRAVERQKHVDLVTPLAERIALIEQLRFVDEVVSYSDVFQGPLLDALDIDVFACGEEYGSDSRYPEQQKTLDYCATNDIRVARIVRTAHVSSTAVRSRLRSFWSSRAAKARDLPAGVTTLGSFHGDQDKVREQTARECALIIEAAARADARTLLDLGCGDGRHLAEISGNFERVTGVDYAEELIGLARSRLSTTAPQVQLEVDDVTEFESDEAFDIILLSGITPCLDDLQLERLFGNIDRFSHDESRLLIRSSISLDKRIDLINFFSAELGEPYTAYYRTPSEMVGIGEAHGWSVLRSGELYRHRTDSAVWWFEFARTGAGHDGP
ncbi:MAG: methyltransferase domain-containing protein [Azoarcus sp.]|nr:methyltransferase domain-containing protein [Azoarcus sp.]